MFTCRVAGQPPPDVHWTKDGEKLRSGGKYKLGNHGDEHTLEIRQASAKDAGSYCCTLSSVAGVRDCSADLTVQSAPSTVPSAPSMDFRAVLKKRSESTSALESSSNTAPRKFSLSDSRSTTGVKPDFRSVLAKQSDNSSQQYLDKTTGGLNKFDFRKPPRPADQIDFRSVLNQKGNKSPSSRSNDADSDSRSGGSVDHTDNSSVVVQKSNANIHGLLSTPTTNGHKLGSNVQPCSNGNRTRKNGQEIAVPVFIREHRSISQVTTNASAHNVALDIRNNHNGHRNSVSSNTSDDSGIEQGEFRTVVSKRVVVLNSHDTEKPKEAIQQNDPINAKSPVISSIVSAQQKDNLQQPCFLSKLLDLTVQEGTEAVFECKIVAVPKASISWTFNKKEIKSSKFVRIIYIDDVARLVISEAFPEDDGEYTCTATNSAGSASCSCDLFVEELSLQSSEQTDEEGLTERNQPESPRVYDISPGNLTALKGTTASIQASFSADPKPQIKWQRNKADILPDARVSVNTREHFSTLEIHNVQPGDSGKYTFVVENDLGLDSGTASIQVEDIPGPPVARPSAVDIHRTSITLSWYGPAYDGGSPVTCYTVEMCQADGEKWKTITKNCENMSHHVMNLDPETAYKFRVSAENKHGVSEPSQTSAVVLTAERKLSLRLNSMESDDELPFEPRHVTMSPDRKFEDSYKLLEELGRGKFGSVYRCLEISTGSRFAAKVIKCREKEKANVKREVEIMNDLTHPKLLMLRDGFEAPRSVILVSEFVGGGELFERVIDDDFELTERDCVHFMRQICDGVGYMHSKFIIHLDLKPENILCVRPESNLIKIIDFGLARYHQPGESVRVLFGTPEFIAPEVVNYEKIGFATDMWSLGAICYVLLSGLSPFMGDSDAETLSNVTRGEFDFDDETFDDISDDAKDFIEKLLVKNPTKRVQIADCHQHRWLTQTTSRLQCKRLSTGNLKRFMARRKWQVEEEVEIFSHTPSGGEKNKDPATSGALHNGTRNEVVQPRTTSTSNSLSRNNGLQERFTRDDIVSMHNFSSRVRQTRSDNMVSNHVTKKDRTLKPKTVVSVSSPAKTVNTSELHLRSTKDDVTSRLTDSSRSTRCVRRQRPSANPVGSLKFVKKMLDAEAFPCDSARFDVRASGEPEPRLLWYHEDEEIYEDHRHVFSFASNGDCSLIIKNVTEDDEGEYTCRAFNRHGDVTCSAELIICGTGAFSNMCVK